MSAPLLATKLYIPPVHPELVSRPRLIERLDSGLDRRLTLVSAPAGFGKTTLVAEWLGSIVRPRTWLSLDKGDNDPVQFLTYLIAALRSVHEGIGQATLSLLASPQLPPIQSLMTLVINDVAATPQRFLLVLDDYDTIDAEAIHHAVEFLIEHGPQQLHLVLVTRQDPPLPLPRLRVRRQVTEVYEQDLRFTTEEAGAFLKRALGLHLDPGIIAALDARTEGWIAGLQLAAHSVRGRTVEGIAEFVSTFSGSHRHVIDYLAEEVLARQSEEVRDFLRRTSILDRLTASLCDELTGRSDSRDLLRQLDSANLFLVPLDDQRAWYRYHHLFADYLRTELDAEAQASLHARASRWLLAHGLLPEAVHHVLASGDPNQAARIVALASAEAFHSGSLATVQGWLDALGENVVRGNGDLATYQGYLLFFTGQPSQAGTYVDAAGRSLPSDAASSSRGRLLGLQAHLALCADDRVATVRYAREALASLDWSDTVFRNLTSNLLGQVLEQEGDLIAAADVYRQAARSQRGAGPEVGALILLTNLVFALNELGHRREAVTVCRRTVEKRSPGLAPAFPVNEGIYLAWSLLSYEANELEQARDQVARALDLARQANIADGILWGRLILARVLLAQGEPDAARQVAREGSQFVSERDVYQGKAHWFEAIETQVNLLEGNLAAAETWVRTSGFSPADSPTHWDELHYLVYVRVLLAQNRLDDALKLLSTIQRSASQGERRRKLITIYLLQAVARWATGDSEKAASLVGKALDLAAPQDYRRAFLDEGPGIVGLLPQVHHLAPAFVSQLLQAASATGSVPPKPQMETLLEPLTDRELEILRLIAAGRSNPEIAERLYLSLNTVKWHAKNLYGKLHAGSRIQVVARARELHLL